MSGGVSKAVALTAIALVLSACATTASKPKPVAAAKPAGFTATPGLDPIARARRVIDLLGMGQTGQARAEALALTAEQPDSPTARKLLNQIDMNPRQMLGERNFPYKVRPGDTLGKLADRYLGDPMLFYVLARYNGLSLPADNLVGQTILIPGVAPSVRKKAAPAAPAPSSTPAAASAAPAAPTRDPARASQLRGLALENMSSGAIDQAVSRLRQAQVLDPANALIKRDLDRATRIQATVHGR